MENWCYGVARVNSGLISFSFRKQKEEKAISQFKEILKKEEGLMSGKQAKELSDFLLETFLKRERNEALSNKVLRAGSVANHIDGGKIHQSIILDVDDLDVLALFLTTNPYWNRRARKITREEANLAGFYGSITNTYLAPVIRSKYDFAISNFSLFPQHRIEDLIEEFPWSQAHE